MITTSCSCRRWRETLTSSCLASCRAARAASTQRVIHTSVTSGVEGYSVVATPFIIIRSVQRMTRVARRAPWRPTRHVTHGINKIMRTDAVCVCHSARRDGGYGHSRAVRLWGDIVQNTYSCLVPQCLGLSLVSFWIPGATFILMTMTKITPPPHCRSR